VNFNIIANLDLIRKYYLFTKIRKRRDLVDPIVKTVIEGK